MHTPTMTVKQTLQFAYECKHKGDSAEHAKMIMKALGLFHVADTVVGDALIRGVSGGERRRVSVAEMWAVNTRVLSVSFAVANAAAMGPPPI